MADESILDFLLKAKPTQPKIPMAQVAANAESLARNEMPEGIDTEALLADLVAKQQANEAQSQKLNEQVMVGVAEQGALQLQVKDALDRVTSFQAASTDADVAQIEAQGEIDLANTRAGVFMDDELNSVLDAASSKRTATEEELNNTFAEIYADQEVLEANANAGIIDLITHPIQTIKTRFAAEEAKNRLAVNKDKVIALDTQNQVNTRMLQQRVDSYNVEKTLARIQDVNLYEKNTALATAATVLQSKTANYGEVVDNLGKFYGLKNQQLQGVESQLRILAEQGSLNANSVDAVMKIPAYKMAQLQYDEAAKNVKDNADLQSFYDAKMKEVGKALGMPDLDSMAKWSTMVEAGLATDEMKYLVQTTFTSGTTGTASMFGATNSSKAAAAIMATQPDLIPEKMREWISTVDTQKVGAMELRNTADYAEDPDAARDAYMKATRLGMDLDIDVATRNKLFTPMSPHNMDLSKIAGIPAEVLPTLQKLRINTSTFDSSVSSMLAVGGNLNIPANQLVKYAEAFAILSKYQFDGLNRDTGLGLQYMRNKHFTNAVTGRPGDARNPNDWHIELLKARREAERSKLGQVWTPE